MAASTRPLPDPGPAGPPTAPEARPAGPHWRVRLLGAVEAQGPSGNLSRWPSRAVATLLARVALAPDRAHPREELIELLWPGVALDVGRNRLRQALSTLKGLLEPDADAPDVLQADRITVRAAPGALVCDALEFERCLRAGDTEQARQWHRGELMPGYYDDWVLEERGRLTALFERLDDMPLLPAAPPRAGAAETREPMGQPGQLPSHWTRLFGIELSASRLVAMIRQERLVTVFGAGGAGKTRLAIEAARALQDPRPWALGGHEPEAPAFDRVAFVSLIDCTEPHTAIDAIASALGLVGRDPMARIAGALAGRRTLVVLDNFEQLVGRADAMLQQLLIGSEGLHLVVTSRLRLDLDGEQVFELAGLGLPDPSTHRWPGDPEGASRWTGHPAVALFADRARAARPDFTLGPHDEAAVCRLVRLLAGMPLAIELAASRMRSLSPAELLTLLSEGDTPMLDLLVRSGAAHSLAQRHTSMRHVVEWSWRQLDPPLVAMMGAMASFAVPATLETVADVADLDVRTARQRIEQLRDHSLLVARPDAHGRQRFALLQPVREFVAERVDPAHGARARERLRTSLIEFGRRCAQRAHQAIAEVEDELPQIYAAILGAAADGAHRQAVQIAAALRRHWEVDTRASLPQTVARALDQAQAQLDEPALRCEACLLLSLSRTLDGSIAEGLAFADTALSLAPDARLRSHALLRRVGAILFSGGDLSNIDEPLAEALVLARQVDDLEAQGLILRMQFVVAGNRDDDNLRAEALAQQVQNLWERLGHRRNAYSGLMDRASCWIEQGRYDEAVTALAACEQVARQEHHATGTITSSWQLGRASMRLRQPEQALGAFQRCVSGSWEHNRLAYLADALVLTPGGLAMVGRNEDAARLQGFAVPHWQRQSGDFYPELDRDVRFTRRLLRLRLGPVRSETLRLEGAGMSLPEAVALALSSAAPGESAL